MYSSIILIVLQKEQNDVFLFEKFSPDVRWKRDLFTVTIPQNDGYVRREFDIDTNVQVFVASNN